jgi:sarcosine oxidase subunit delta
MRIPCCHCGARDSEEFTYLGDATPARPAPDAGAPQWAAYVYLRDNPSGVHRELWQHVAGCRSWLVVTRKLRTHEILKVEPARDVALARAQATRA